MINELHRLMQSESLLALLRHYVSLTTPDRQAWHDRCMELPGCEPRDLTALHGELLAYGWIDQNTAVVERPRPGQVPACYRASLAGLRAYKQALAEVEPD
jgi:hypothetical protein